MDTEVSTIEPFVRAPAAGSTLDVLGVTHIYKATGAETAGSFSLWEAVVPPGAGAPPHTHTNEDHAFIVLMGEVEFVGPNGEKTYLRKNQGILLPRNCLYTFTAAASQPLVMLRVGATVDPDKSPYARVLADGTPMIGNSKENNAIPCKFKPGAFFR